MAMVSINNLLEAGCHFGHQKRRWNPKMKPFIFGARNGITIFDLRISIQALANACGFLRDTVAAGGDVLFVGTKRQAQEVVMEAAKRTGMFYMCDRWLGGTLTNNKVVLSRVARMKELQRQEADGELDKLNKREAASRRRERQKLEATLGGIADMRKLPAALVVVDVMCEDIAVHEANILDIPVVGIVDSSCNPDPIEYVIPANDDALKSIKVIVDALAAAIEEGRMMSGREVPAKAVAEAAAEGAKTAN